MVAAPRDVEKPLEAQLRGYNTDEIRNIQITVSNDLHRSPRKSGSNSSRSFASDSESEFSVHDESEKRRVTYSKSFNTSKSLRRSIRDAEEDFDDEIDTQNLRLPMKENKDNVLALVNFDEISNENITEMLRRVQEARNMQQNSLLRSEQDFFKLRHHNRCVTIVTDLLCRLQVNIGGKGSPKVRAISYNTVEDVLDPLVESGAYQYIAWKEWENKNPNPTPQSNSHMIFSGAKQRKSISFAETVDSFAGEEGVSESFSEPTRFEEEFGGKYQNEGVKIRGLFGNFISFNRYRCYTNS
jgi:hypothetical protein